MARVSKSFIGRVDRERCVDTRHYRYVRREHGWRIWIERKELCMLDRSGSKDGWEFVAWINLPDEDVFPAAGSTAAIDR